MFKSVEYAGFDGRPELRAKAEQAMPLLTRVVRNWDRHVNVTWEAYPDPPSGAELTLHLTLPAADGTASRLLTLHELSDPEVLEDRCRSVWLRTTDAYFEKRKPAWDEIINQPAEV